jgi:HEAT repeat protein
MSKGTEQAEDGPTANEIQSARNVIGSFLLALKNYSIYPEDHSISQKFLINVKANLDPFLEQYGSLRLNVEKDGLFYRNVAIHQISRGEEDHLASLLFRDGILWLECLKGTDTDEIATLFRIMNNNRTVQDEPEGDLVTDLWEEDLPHIRYEAAELFCESDAFDLSLLKVSEEEEEEEEEDDDDEDEDVTGGQEDNSVCDATESESEDTDDTGGATKEQRTAPSTTIPAVRHDSVQLTPQEQKRLRDFVNEEESRNNVEDVLDILLIVLCDQNQEEEFSAILEALKEKFKDSLAQGELRSALNTLKRLREIHRADSNEQSWRIPVLEDFFFSIATPQILGALEPVLSNLEPGNTDQIKLLRQIFVLLPPEAIRVLGPMLLQVSSRDVQRQMLEVIGHLSKKDIRPLEDLLKHPDDRLVYRLVVVLRHLKGKKPFQLLLNMTRHSSERVRREALTGLLKHGSHVLKRVFFLIEDPNPMIRNQIIEYLGRERNVLSEDLLREYLERKELGITDDLHLIACYRSLGLCGSSGSIPFLKQRLMERVWSDKLGFGTSPHRQGAAIALAALGTEDADKILEDASRSLFPGIRRAYQEAVERNK